MLNVRTIALAISFAVLCAAGCNKGAESEPKATAPESAEMAQNQQAEAAKPVETAPVADEPAKASGTTCDQFAAHIATLFETISGDQAMITKDDVPKLIKGCEREGTVATQPEAVACIMDASDEAELKACKPSLMSLMMEW